MDYETASRTLADMKSGKIRWDDNLKAQADNVVNSGGGGGSSQGAPNYDDITRRALEMHKTQSEPFAQTIEGGIPIVSQKFETQRQQLSAEKTPLEQRYQNLLSEISSRQQAEESRASIATSRELGRRGISSESGYYDQAINETLSPITRNYSTQAVDVGLQREASLRELDNLIANLTGQETEQLQGIRTSAAQVRASSGEQALQSALSQYQMQQSAYENALQRALQERQLNEQARQQEIQNQFQQDQAGEQKRQFDLGYGLSVQQANKPSSMTQAQISSTAKNSLLSAAAGGATLTQLMQQFGGQLDVDEIVKLYTTVSPYGTPNEDWAKKILGLSNNQSGGINYDNF